MRTSARTLFSIWRSRLQAHRTTNVAIHHDPRRTPLRPPISNRLHHFPSTRSPHLALASKHWKTLVIPSHIEYLIPRVSNYQYYERVWEHLAENPGFAGRIHTVMFDPCFLDPTPHRLSAISPAPGSYDESDIFPNAYLKEERAGSKSKRVHKHDAPIHDAVANMISLQAFCWHFSDFARSGGITTGAIPVFVEGLPEPDHLKPRTIFDSRFPIYEPLRCRIVVYHG